MEANWSEEYEWVRFPVTAVTSLSEDLVELVGLLEVTAEGHDFGSNGWRKFQSDSWATVGVVIVDSATSWSNLMSDRNGVEAIVIDYRCKRLEKEGSSNELVSYGIARAYGYISIW